MQAIVLDGFGGPEVMRFDNVDNPLAGPGQILIRVVATSVNRPDIVQREGNYPPPKGDSPILGLEVAGRVEAVGDGVTRFSAGDRVMALIGGGGYSELALAYEAHTMPIPDALSFEQAACVCETYITAYLNLFELGRLKESETALVHGGGGGVNTAALQLVSVLTPKATTIVTASPTKVDRVRALGATHVIDYRSADIVTEVARITDRSGADVILDHIGADYLAANLKSLAINGRLVIIGIMSGAKATVNLGALMVKRQQILGSVLRSRSREEKGKIISRFSERVLPFFADRSIAPLVSGVFPLAAAADAHREMEASTHFGKIVLSVGDG